MKKIALIGLALVTGVLTSIPLPAAAAVTECRGTIRDNVVGDVVVPRGVECGINARIDGNITVLDSGWLFMDGGNVTGNITADRANRVQLRDARVAGNIIATGNRNDFNLYGMTIEGSVSVNGSMGEVVIGSSLITGSVSVTNNTPEQFQVTGNTIGSNLVCERNNIAPAIGEVNIVSGSATGQCRSISERPTSGSGPVDVYITPGFHKVNNRMWRTACQSYSTTERCRTEIQATVVQYANGRFTAVNGWAFNNLTYKASSRAVWGGNPLGGYGKVKGTAEWFGSDGRQWRTECDTALTGRRGCRTWAVARVIENRNGQYVWVSKEILNNMVRFK